MDIQLWITGDENADQVLNDLRSLRQHMEAYFHSWRGLLDHDDAEKAWDQWERLRDTVLGIVRENHTLHGDPAAFVG